MAFVLFKKESADIYLTIDNTGRIYLSAELMRKLGGHKQGVSFCMYFEFETRRVGINKLTRHEGAEVTKVDSRGYGSIRKYLKRFGIDYNGESIRYNFDGMADGVMAFKLEAAGDYGPTILKQEKNGNLERIS